MEETDYERGEGQYQKLYNFLTTDEINAIPPTEEQLEDIIAIASQMRKHTFDRGLSLKRCAVNEREKAFSDKWYEENNPRIWLNGGGGTLQDLMRPHEIEVTDRERQIVATIIQWLGSNVGFCFLQESLKKCGYYIKQIE